MERGREMLLSILNGIYKGQRQSKQSVNRAVSHTYIMMSLAVYTHTRTYAHAHTFIHSFTSTNKQDESGFLCLSLRLFDSEERDIITYGNLDQLGFFYAWLDEKGGLVFPYLMMGKNAAMASFFANRYKTKLMSICFIFRACSQMGARSYLMDGYFGR